MDRPAVNCIYRPGATCFHTACYLTSLAPPLAARLRSNYQAHDYARNWGKMLYDPKEHGRDARRRKLLATILRQMRKGQADYAEAVRAAAWIGATLP